MSARTTRTLQRTAAPAGVWMLLTALILLAALGLAAGVALKAWQSAKPASAMGRAKSFVQVTLGRDAPFSARPAAPTTAERGVSDTAPRKQRTRAERPVAAPRPAAPRPAPAGPIEKV